MDIYSFINSKDIAEHCRKLGHVFTPVEQAVIVFYSKRPLAIRHAAWQNIIDTQPDMKVVDWPDSKHVEVLHVSLHQYLKEYMRIESTLADRLMAAEPGAVYTYAVEYIYKNHSDPSVRDSSVDCCETPYSIYDMVINAIDKESVEELNFIKCIKAYRVYKRWIDNEEYLSAEVTQDGEIIRWHSKDGILEENDDNLASAFHDISIYIPAPFCKGDILTFSGSKPFVLVSDEWKYGKKHCPEGRQYLAEGEWMDNICCYYLREDGSVYSDFNAASLNLEYYKGELAGLNRVLKVISSHMKGTLPVDLMMNFYEILLREEEVKRLRKRLWYTDEELALAGLGTAAVFSHPSGIAP